MWQSLHDAWWRLATQSQPRSVSDVFASRVLRSAAAVYQAGVRMRNLAFDRGWVRQARLPAPVISVGNLTLGGAGKTACAELIAKRLLARGLRVAVLTRGYGGTAQPYVLHWRDGAMQVDGVPFGRPAAEALADEPQLLAERLPDTPIIVDRQRVRGGRLAIERFGAEALVLDDGFQHRQMARDCDIVLVHARTPLAGWALFPRGPMREPLEALARAHVAVVTKVSDNLETVHALAERLKMINPELAVVTSEHIPIGVLDRRGTAHPLSMLAGKRVGLVSSIGDPDGFETTVRRLGVAIAWHRRYPDHHAYQPADLVAIEGGMRGGRPDAVLTTEKDWVRLARAWPAEPSATPWWALRIEMQIMDGDAVLDDRLARLHAR